MALNVKPTFLLPILQDLSLHAHSLHAAALLCPHWLTHPPGSSGAAVNLAIRPAHDVLMSISGNAELEMLLCPVFIAATELLDDEDRSITSLAFGMIWMQWETVTSLQTKGFTVQRVWKARDVGRRPDWMVLVQQCPGEGVPICRSCICREIEQAWQRYLRYRSKARS